MKSLLKVNNTSNSTGIALLLARIGIAALMLTHGIPKMMTLFSGAPVQFPPVMGLTPEISLGLAVFAEVVCSIFLLAGYATRFATIPLIITMLVAALLIHSADPFGKQELPLLYSLVYVALLFLGSGKYSVDYLIQSKKPAEIYSVERIRA